MAGKLETNDGKGVSRGAPSAGLLHQARARGETKACRLERSRHRLERALQILRRMFLRLRVKLDHEIVAARRGQARQRQDGGVVVGLAQRRRRLTDEPS